MSKKGAAEQSAGDGAAKKHVDFSALQITETPSRMTVLDPGSGVELDTVIDLISQEAAPVQDVAARITDKRTGASSIYGLKAGSVAQFRKDQIEVLVACTVGWEHMEWQGEELPFSPDNARKVYTALPWLRNQVTRFTTDLSNFLPA